MYLGRHMEMCVWKYINTNYRNKYLCTHQYVCLYTYVYLYA